MKKHTPFLGLVFVNLLIMLLFIGISHTQAQTTLYSETFTATDGTTTGTGNPAKWTRNIGALSPNRFEVRSNVFEAKEIVGQAVWQSQTIFIQGWENVSISVDMPTIIDNMEATDSISFYYKLNGGAETAFTTNGINTGNFAAGRVASHTGLKGNTLQIIVRVRNDSGNEDHFFDNVTVTGSQNFYVEDFSGYANGTTTSSKWSITGTGNIWSVQSNEMKGTNVSGGGDLVWSSSVMDISAYSSVSLSALLRDDSDDKKENSDYIRVYYKLDGGSEQQFSTNGNNTNDFANPYTLTASHSGLSGSTIQIIIRIKSNANDEEYYFDNVTMTASFTPAAISPTTAKTDVTCNAGTDGTVSISAMTGGRAPFTYSWSNGATTQNISSVAAGSYTVTVTGQTGTTATSSKTVTQPDAYDFTKTYSDYNGANVSCNGSTNGSVDLTVTGNTPGNGTFTNYGISFDGTDDYINCGTGSSISLNGTAITVEAWIKPTSMGADNGVIVKTSSDSWNDGYGLYVDNDNRVKFFINHYSNNVAFASLTADGQWHHVAGTYDGSTIRIFVDGVEGTSDSYSSSIVNSSNNLEIGRGFNNSWNYQGSIDQVRIWNTAVSGTNLNNYKCVNDISAHPNIANLRANYIMNEGSGTSAADNSGNSNTGTISGASWISGSNVNYGCYQQMGYTYVWSTGAITEDISGRGAGSYTVTVTDANGCTGSTSATLTQPAAVSSSTISKTNVSCIGLSDGTASLTPAGTSPFTFNWSNGSSSEDQTGLSTAAYTVTITDANGCSASKSTTLTNPSTLTVSVTSSTNVLCRGNSTGAVNITATGGTAPLTYLWSNGATTEDLTNIPAGSYTVTVTSNGNSGCTVSTSRTITQPAAALTVQETTNHISCNNYNDGSITLTPSGGTGAKTYAWTGGLTTSSRSNLSGGTYSYTVTDAGGCAVSDTVLIINPSVLSASESVTHQTDANNPNGAIDLTPSGGRTPYSYLWNKQGEEVTTQDRSGLQSNYYSVTITDAGNCQVVRNMMVSFMDSIKTGSYIINLGVTPQTIGNGLKPYGMVYDLVRNYKIPVEWVIKSNKSKDGIDFSHNGVDYKSSAFIIKEEYIDNTIRNRITYWNNQGVVGAYTVSNFTAPVYGTLTGFSNVGVDEDNADKIIPYFNNASIPTSMYYVGLPSDLDNCEDAYILPHADPTWATHHYLKDFVQTGGFIWTGCHAVSVIEGISNPSNINDRMNFLSTNGLKCYDDELSKCGNTISEYHDDPVSPYTYNSAYDVHPIMQFMGDLTPTTENGSEQMYIPQSTGRWNTGTMRAITTPDGSAGKEGTKLVFGRAFDNKENGMVMYQAGHTAHEKGTIANQVAAERAFFNFILHASIYNKIIATATIPSAMSEGSSAAVSVSVSDGTPPYTYLWTTNVSGTFDNATAASTTFNLNAGNGGNWARISVKVTDACGRNFFATKSLVVLYLEGTRVSDYNGYNVSCHGENDGYISVDVEGGTPPYEFNWSTGANTSRIDNLTAGNYYVTITDALDYELVDTFVITQPNILTVNLNGTASVLCHNSTSGSVTSDVLGGSTPYTYLWSNGAETEDITGVGGGTFTLEVSDANGCAASDNHTITAPDALEVEPTVTDVSCYNDNDGAVNITVTGGTGSKTFLWSNSAVSEDISALTDGSYTVTVTDANGCTVTSQSDVDEPDELILSGTTTDVSCYGANDGDVAFTSSGGTAPVIVYNFEGPQGELPETLTNMYGTAEWYWAIDAHGCESYFYVEIAEPDPIIISDNTTDVTCNGDIDGAIDVTVVGGVAPLTYLWATSETTQDLSGITNGSYTITVTDDDGCTASSTLPVTASSNIATLLDVTDESADGAEDGSIDQTVSGGVAPYDFIWSNAAVTEDVSSLAPGHYTVTITDDLGCIKSAGAFIMGYPYNGKFWTGAVSIDWKNDNNWSPPGVPTEVDSAIIPHDAVRQPTILAGTAAEAGFLDVRAGATLTMTSTSTLSLYGNMNIYGSFVHGNGTVKFMGSSETNYYSDKRITFYNLVMQNSSETGLQMHKSFRVQNNIAFNDGLIFTNEDTIFALNNSTSSLTNHSDTSFVVGKFNRAITSVVGSYKFPLGRYVEGEKKQFHCEIFTNGLIGVSNITVFFDYWSEAEDKNVNFQYGDIVINRLYDEGKWIVEPNAQPIAGFYSMILYISNFTQIEDNNFAIIKRPLGGGKQDWGRGTGTYPEQNSAGRMVSDGYAKLIGLTSFSEFGVGGGGGGGLPVKWLDFTGEKYDDDKVLLQWSTGSEVNNDYFTVERADDGETFEALGTVNATGNSSTASHYSFVDKNPMNDINYYRIKQTDNDGEFEYTSIIAVMFNQVKSIITPSIVNVYPNPSDGEFSIDYEGGSDTFSIYVMNMRGEIVKSFTKQVDKAKKKSIRMNLRGSLAPGAYTIIVDENNNRVFRKMVITN